ncbi:MAG TPA: hypothetical protein DDY71_04545 [Spirochaetia bacterium]|nr:hypothetical protein [Spirochaetia bacterium]HLD97803.1 hypothetical protein [Candidatus Nanoarchaeia archaeon]
MSKVKAIIIGSIILIFFSMGVTIQVLSRKYRAEKADKERLWQNNLELSAKDRQYSKIIYSKDEFIQIQSDSLKQALNDLKIKPKEVIKIIYRTITDIDTIDREVFVDYRKTHWMVSDTGKCFTWSAMAFLSDTTLKVTRTDFSYENQTTDYFYQSRPKKFLFIRYGKKKVRQVTVPKCGNSTEKVIEILKE